MQKKRTRFNVRHFAAKDSNSLLLSKEFCPILKTGSHWQNSMSIHYTDIIVPSQTKIKVLPVWAIVSSLDGALPLLGFRALLHVTL